MPRLTKVPEALPGSCKSCGSASKPPYIDTGTSEEFHGAVYYCHECLAEMSRLIGFATPEEVTRLKQRVAEFETELYHAKMENDGLRRVLDGFAILRTGGGASSDSVSDASADLAEPAAADGAGVVAEGTREPAESVHDEGVAVVSDDADSHSFTLSL